MDSAARERCILDPICRARKEAKPTMRFPRVPARLRRWLLVTALVVGQHGAMARAAELMAAARASIQAEDARRHVAALADDALEGREGGSRGGRAAGAYIVSHLEKLGLEPAGDQGGYFQQFGSLRNILALARGSDPTVAGELVVIGAHYDHVGYGNSANSYGPFGFVHNGADDNASGVAGLIEVAEALSRLPARPRRPILFAFWDGEEKGLLGSYHFLRSRPAALAAMTPVFSVNLDMIGRLRGERLEIYGGRTSVGLRAAVVESNNRPGATPLELVFDWAIEEDSDHYPFIAARIPTVMFHTGLHDQYHRPGDDVHLVNFAGIEPVARLALDFVTTVADAPGPPRVFRDQARSESDITRKALEAPASGTPASLPPPLSADGSAPQRPRWGIGTRSDPGEPMHPVVVRVTPGSPAARAGLSLGDRLVAIDGVAVTNQADMIARLAAAPDTVSVAADRRGRMVRIEMSIAPPLPPTDPLPESAEGRP